MTLPDVDGPPVGRVEPAGTFLGRPRWRVYVADGLMSWGPEGYGWHVTGTRAKAEAKARKVLARYLRQHADGRAATTVHADEPDPVDLLDLRTPRGPVQVLFPGQVDPVLLNLRGLSTDVDRDGVRVVLQFTHGGPRA